MMLVVVIMAASAVMAFAMLSSASLQSQAGVNRAAAVSADSVTESGTSYALYNLLNPDKIAAADLEHEQGMLLYDPHENLPTIETSDGSRVTYIHMGAVDANKIELEVRATGSNAGSTIKRIRKSQMEVSSRYDVKYAMASNGPFTMPLTWLTSSINGPVRCDGGYGGLLSAVIGTVFGTSENPTPLVPTKAAPGRDPGVKQRASCLLGRGRAAEDADHGLCPEDCHPRRRATSVPRTAPRGRFPGSPFHRARAERAW